LDLCPWTCAKVTQNRRRSSEKIPLIGQQTRLVVIMPRLRGPDSFHPPVGTVSNGTVCPLAADCNENRYVSRANVRLEDQSDLSM
jgi:hypothetical protein